MNYEKLICGKNLIIKDVMKCIEDNAKGTAFIVGWRRVEMKNETVTARYRDKRFQLAGHQDKNRSGI